MKKIFKTAGMHCKSCAILVEDAVSAIKGVSGVKADFAKNEVEVVFADERLEKEIRSAIEKEGYKVKD